LCKQCHDGPAQQVEKRGYSTEVGPNGLPLDPNHPFHNPRSPSHCKTSEIITNSQEESAWGILLR
jgi:hypothetical protein